MSNSTENNNQVKPKLQKFISRQHQQLFKQPKQYQNKNQLINFQPLLYGTECNFTTWKENMENAVTEKYGDVGYIFTDEELPEYPLPEYPLLYIAKRFRPDILTAISFLTTRVNCSTEQDMKKLTRVIKYIYGTQDLGIILKPGQGKLSINSYVDASYGLHMDGKSHSGLYIALGHGPVFVKSSKQKIVTKSSTEAELVALSDACSQVIWSKDFLVAQGYDMSSVVMYEDNKSTLMLIQKGKATSERTRHINVRYNFVKEKIDSNEVDVKYMPTDKMIADILTKPIVGKRFQELRTKLLNWHY